MNVTGDARLIRKSGELDDAVATISRAGLDPEKFDFEVQRLPDRVDPVLGRHSIQWAVKVTNRVTGRGKTVAGGHGEAWVECLEHALKAGEFG
jgi:hypothetical protein